MVLPVCALIGIHILIVVNIFMIEADFDWIEHSESFNFVVDCTNVLSLIWLWSKGRFRMGVPAVGGDVQKKSESNKVTAALNILNDLLKLTQNLLYASRKV